MDKREYQPDQQVIFSSGKMPPPCPSLVDLMRPAPKPAPKPKYKTRPTEGYRNIAGNGDGWCGRCKQPKKSKEFATKSGRICIDCKTDKRGKAK